MLPLKCCLMSISLPWEYIVYDLLSKVKSLFLLLYSSMKIGSILDCGIVLLFTRSVFISIIFLILLLAVPIGKLKLSVAILGYEHYLSMFILLLGAGADFLTCTKRVLIHLIIAISGKSSKYTTLSFVKIYKGPSDRLQVEIKCGINSFRMISFNGTWLYCDVVIINHATNVKKEKLRRRETVEYAFESETDVEARGALDD
ncbi:hypothetical protein NC653_006216 [Populus alba x Populus x berolinensis]|uniref:Uncharacterized protein n=1 Tax=Populus alba x Populus x berolinensis TaxID=444605 RepID=A0AAD6RDV3_9ROSI|nr:hypothetical protein NC653_006216 [Populus alba x Populus x berolinensis]